MINLKKIYKSFKFSLYLSLLIIFSCDESNSIILNPPNSNDFKVKSFMIDANSSFSYRESQFNAGDSERIYLGKVDDNKAMVSCDVFDPEKMQAMFSDPEMKKLEEEMGLVHEIYQLHAIPG